MEGSLSVFSASSFGSSFLILPMSAFRSFALSPFRFLSPAFLSSHFLCAFYSLFFFVSSIFFFSSSFQIIIFPESILCSHIFSSLPLMLPFHLPLLYFPVFHLSLSHILIFYFPFLFHLSNIHFPSIFKSLFLYSSISFPSFFHCSVSHIQSFVLLFVHIFHSSNSEAPKEPWGARAAFRRGLSGRENESPEKAF